jgi:CheY-like chemotaxis protein
VSSQIEQPGFSESLEQSVRERTVALEAQSEKLRALARDLVENQSRERRRLAQILHDQFQQLVSAAKMKIGIMRRRSSDETTVDSLKQAERLLEEALTASRSLATELCPPVLHDGGLASALPWLARYMEQTHELCVNVEMSNYQEPDNEHVRVILFECIRELLLNVVEHAGVKSADLIASVSDEGLLHIHVVDRGIGFDPKKAESTSNTDGKFGLLGISERLSLIGGLAKITSIVGQGTTVELIAPATFNPQTKISVAMPVPPTGLIPAPKMHRILRVLVADDHKLFREGLISLLSQEPYLKFVGESGDGQEAIELARELRPDIMIVDVSMPKINGVQVASILSQEQPQLRIVGLSMHERDDMALAMRKAGAIAYCSKSAPVEVLVHILRDAALSDDPTLAPVNSLQ